jgi:Flp pilus assembly protein TadD
LEFYQQASAKAPTELAYLLAEAEMMVAMNHSAEALDMLKGKVVYFEHSGTIRDAVGQLLMEAGRYEEAVPMFREASILSEDDLGIHERLAMALFHTKRYRQSAEILSRLVQNDGYSKRTDLFLVLAQCQLAIGKPRDARYSVETATQLEPYNAHAWQCLGRASLECGDLRRAEMSLGRSAKLDASCGETYLLLGYTHLRQDKLSNSMADFQKASSLDQRDTVSMCMIGYALQKMGKSDQAMQYYAKALRIKPGDDMATQLMAEVDVRP